MQASRESRRVAIALILRLARQAEKLERKEVLTRAEKRRLLRLRAVRAVMTND